MLLLSLILVPSIAGLLAYWLSVANDGSRVDALEAMMKRHMDQAIGSRATQILVFASVAAFLVGCAFVAWGLLAQARLH